MSERRASIDIGSNSTLLLVAEVENGNVIKVLENESRVTGLGRDLDKKGHFIEIAMDETFEALQEYKDICLKHNISPSEVLCTATEASRVAKNSKSFFEKVKKELGIKTEIITGIAEAYFSTKGILQGESGENEMAIMDIGGASTEFILTDSQGNIKTSFSMPVGSVRMTNWIEEGVVEERFKSLLKEWGDKLKLVECDTLSCVAGTMTSLANMHLDHRQFVENEVHGHILKKKDIVEMAKKYCDWDSDKFLDRFPFLGKRSRAIKGGLLLAKKISENVNVNSFKVSTYGLRYGTLLEGEISDERKHGE